MSENKVKVVVLRAGFSFNGKSAEPGQQVALDYEDSVYLKGHNISIPVSEYKANKSPYDAFIEHERKKAGLDSPKKAKPTAKEKVEKAEAKPTATRNA